MTCRKCGKTYEEHGYFDITLCSSCNNFEPAPRSQETDWLFKHRSTDIIGLNAPTKAGAMEVAIMGIVSKIKKVLKTPVKV